MVKMYMQIQLFLHVYFNETTIAQELCHHLYYLVLLKAFYIQTNLWLQGVVVELYITRGGGKYFDYLCYIFDR
jgi:hypothetical protein